MKPQTIAQILRGLSLGGYTASVVDEELKIRGPQPLAGPLPASVEANCEEIIDFLSGCCGGVWPAAEGSEFANLVRILTNFGPTPSDPHDRPDVLPTASPCPQQLVRGA